GGVIPKPAAAFSQLAMTRSTAYRLRSSGRRAATIMRPGRPKMSPIKRIFKIGSHVPAANHPANTQLSMVPRENHRNRLWAADLSRPQKIVIARWIQVYVSDSPRVHEHVIAKP